MAWSRVVRCGIPAQQLSAKGKVQEIQRSSTILERQSATSIPRRSWARGIAALRTDVIDYADVGMLQGGDGFASCSKRVRRSGFEDR
jgi:hypothetical protein